MYKVFKRTWWKDNPDWPNGLEPEAGVKQYLGWVSSEEEAQRMCREFNESVDPGRYSLKAEYEHG
jgi:hypothetical protein